MKLLRQELLLNQYPEIVLLNNKNNEEQAKENLIKILAFVINRQ